MRELDGPVAGASEAAVQPLSADEFKNFFAATMNTVHVVTFGTSEQPCGLTVSSVTSLSAIPPLAAFNIGLSSSQLDNLRVCEVVVINALSDQQEAIARTYAGARARRFAGTEPIGHAAPFGVPYLRNSPVHAIARIVDRVEYGDHLLVITEIIDARWTRTADQWRPLLYHNRTYATAAPSTRRAL